MNAAVQASVASAPAGGYEVRWSCFNNDTGEATPLGSPAISTGSGVQAPVPLPTEPGAFVKVEVKAVDPPHPSWKEPVQAYFWRSAAGWKLVGLEHLA